MSGIADAGSRRITASSGRAAQGFVARSCQQTNDSRPFGRAAVRKLLNAAQGSSKNMTPKREYTASNALGAKAYACASPSASAIVGRPATRSRARSSIGGDISTPSTCPDGPASSASWSSV
jgi:hypothetical protein